jgi:3-deoxy-7-phosphoheptulonate synthase
MDIAPISAWNLASTQRPILIAGPCSAETELQVLSTCQQIAQQNCAQILRAGIWKPRTRPNSFEGVGTPGLAWIKQAGIENKLPVTVEVANAKHVEEALKAGIDILWIGARTTVNPFAVQEIADALNGMDIPVIIKNPINPDLALWIGAFERLNKSGIKRLAALHRGFSNYEKTKYRNLPQWEIPIELMRQLPSLPIWCDPSHICGNRHLLQSVAQEALDLNFGGLMLETHITPDLAWSDAEQQIVPERLGELMRSLIIRQTSSNDIEFQNTLDNLRDAIDKIDRDIIDMLAKRMRISRQIGNCKNDNNITILQPERWGNLFKQRTQQGIGQGLTPDFMRDFCNAIHKESIRHQTAIMNQNTKNEAHK